MSARMLNLWGYTTQSLGDSQRFFIASITANFNESAQLNNKSKQSQVSASEKPGSFLRPVKVDWVVSY